MEIGLLIAIGFALAFALTNGFHDASNAIATLVATRGATAGQAVVLSAVFNMAGAVLLGTAVADTIGKIVTVPQTQMVAVVGAGLAGATVWNLLTWWLGLPSSSGHALVGGLAGAAIADGMLSGYGGLESVNWGGVEGWHPTGVIGVLIALLISPPLGFLFAFLLVRLLGKASQRWTTRWVGPVRGGGWVAAAGLSFSHGGNDAQKSMGVIAVLLLASGQTEDLTVPLWAKIATGLALTLEPHWAGGASSRPSGNASSASPRWTPSPARPRPPPSFSAPPSSEPRSAPPRWWLPRLSGSERGAVAGGMCAGRSSARWVSPG